VAGGAHIVVNAINTLEPIGVILSNPLQNVVNVLNAIGNGGPGGLTTDLSSLGSSAR
jgi:hypothetical protein